MYCIFYRNSASCTHVSAVLHVLNGLKQSLNLQPDLLPVDNSDDGELNPVLPCTSLPCKWIVPKNRKDSKQQMSAAVFKNMTEKSLLNEHYNPLKILIQDQKSIEALPRIVFLTY